MPLRRNPPVQRKLQLELSRVKAYRKIHQSYQGQRNRENPLHQVSILYATPAGEDFRTNQLAEIKPLTLAGFCIVLVTFSLLLGVQVAYNFGSERTVTATQTMTLVESTTIASNLTTTVHAYPPFFPPLYFTTVNGCDFSQPCTTPDPLEAQQFNCLSEAQDSEGCLLEIGLPPSYPIENYNLTIHIQPTVNTTTGFNCELETYHYSSSYTNETLGAYCEPTNSTAFTMMAANYNFPPFDA